GKRTACQAWEKAEAGRVDQDAGSSLAASTALLQRLVVPPLPVKASRPDRSVPAHPSAVSPGFGDIPAPITVSPPRHSVLARLNGRQAVASTASHVVTGMLSSSKPRNSSGTEGCFGLATTGSQRLT